MERIKDMAIKDVSDAMHLCPMTIPFVADEKHPSGFHLSEDESLFNKVFIKMDCAWKLRGRHNLKECIFSSWDTLCPRVWDESIVTDNDKRRFIREMKLHAGCFNNNNK